MKKIIRRLIDAVVICFIILYSFQGEAAVLQKVERLTDTEKAELSAAQEKANKSNREVEEIKSKIARSHNMEGKSWMEWKTWFQIDGDFILFYYQSHMRLNKLILDR